MNVSIKDFSISMEVKTKGIELEIRDTNNKHLGDLVVTKTGLTWCKGRVTAKNGKKVAWKKFIESMED